MKNLCMIALFLISAVAFGQRTTTLKQDGISVKGNTLTMSDNPPTWPGCEGSRNQRRSCFNQNLVKHVVKNFKYPPNHKSGTKVVVSFIIDKSGKAVVKKVTGGNKPLQAEVKRVIATLPTVEPGHMGGKAKETQYTMPFTF